MPAINMLVYVPEVCHRLPKDHKIPLLVYVDQAGTKIDVSVDTGEPFAKTESTDRYGPFTKIVWIDGLKTKGDRVLKINGSKDGFDPPKEQKCTIKRDPVDVQSREAIKGERGVLPNITSPSDGSSVPSNFAAWGTVAQGESPCTAWLVDGNNNTYPGMAIPGQPPNSWAFGFQNIPAGAPPGTKYTLYVRASTGDQRTETVYVQTGM